MLTMPIPVLIRRIRWMRSLKRYRTLRSPSAPLPGLLSHPLKAPVHTTAASAETVVWISVAGLPEPGGSRPVIAGIESNGGYNVSPLYLPESAFPSDTILADRIFAAALFYRVCGRRRPARLSRAHRREFGRGSVPNGGTI